MERILARKTRNGNFLVWEGNRIGISEYRFVSPEGSHLRWVEDEEADFLCRAIPDRVEVELTLDTPQRPSRTVIWQHVVAPATPELSNNGGSYCFLNRVEKLEGWGDVDGYRIVQNHLYGSDFEEQGWHSQGCSEQEAWEFIENFKATMEA